MRKANICILAISMEIQQLFFYAEDFCLCKTFKPENFLLASFLLSKVKANEHLVQFQTRITNFLQAAI